MMFGQLKTSSRHSIRRGVKEDVWFFYKREEKHLGKIMRDDHIQKSILDAPSSGTAVQRDHAGSTMI